MYALALMKEQLHVDMPEDEAASIAMHILNAEYDISISDTFHATKLMDQIIDIAVQKTGYIMDTENYYCQRFITHLRYLAQRVIQKEQLRETKCDILFEMMAQQYPKEMSCAQQIAGIIWQQHQFKLSKDEMSSFAMHIRRIGS